MHDGCLYGCFTVVAAIIFVGAVMWFVTEAGWLLLLAAIVFTIIYFRNRNRRRRG